MKINFGDRVVFLKEGRYIWSLFQSWFYKSWTCPRCKRILLEPCLIWEKDSEETFRIMDRLFDTGEVLEDTSEEKLCMECFAKRFGLSEEERAVLKTYMALKYED